MSPSLAHGWCRVTQKVPLEKSAARTLVGTVLDTVSNEEVQHLSPAYTYTCSDLI